MSHYDWVPVTKRQPLKWPNGKRLAMIVTINCEYWDLLKDSSKPYYAGGPPTIPDSLPGNVTVSWSRLPFAIPKAFKPTGATLRSPPRPINKPWLGLSAFPLIATAIGPGPDTFRILISKSSTSSKMAE